MTAPLKAAGLLQNPTVAKAAALEETAWLNPQLLPFEQAKAQLPVTKTIVDQAQQRLQRFAPYLSQVFPETAASGGLIESPLQAIPHMECLLRRSGPIPAGKWLLKMDSCLPIAGSIKARGGIHEVLKHSEDLALSAGLLCKEDNYACLARPEFREFFHQYTVQVGSTGNLGLSIGIMSAQLGFQVIVHMSADAKQWKKDLLRQKGVTVVEYASDYSKAVEEGRRRSLENPNSYFVDDENSLDLFAGYAVAGERLKAQLAQQNIAVDSQHPLFVYLPCGIGGAPGGVAFGLKLAFGDHVHCFFTEPTHACCMLLGMATGLHDSICVGDIGIDGKTQADGLAVGRPSAFVGKVMEPLLSGIFTLDDSRLLPWMKNLLDTEGIFIEPSACAAFGAVLHPGAMEEYIDAHNLQHVIENACHIAWATGGRLVPSSVREEYLSQAQGL